MTISVKIPVVGDDGKNVIVNGKPVLKAASLSVTKVMLTVKGKEYDLPLTAGGHEAIGQAVNQLKGVDVKAARNLIADMPAEAILNVYHTGFDVETLTVKKGTSEKTHDMTVKALRQRLEAIEKGDTKSAPVATPHGYQVKWNQWKAANGKRSGEKADLTTIKIAHVWEM